MAYVRPLYNTLVARMAEPRRFLQAVVGPRQVGKTTMISQLLESSSVPSSFFTADAVSVADGQWIADLWEGVRLKMDFAGQSEHWLVIDEVQKVPNWSEVVKREWDRDSRELRNLKVILLGSSRLLIMTGLTESLAGRFELIRAGHWSLAEMRDAFGFSLQQYVFFGGYPGSVPLVDDESRWRAYVIDSLLEPAITKDVLQTANVYKPALLRQLFRLGCSYSAELLSLNKMLAQLQDSGNVTTLASYLQLLRESCMLAALQKFSADAARKYNSIPKYQVFNPALHSVFAPHSFQEVCTDAQLWGRWVENAVGAHLLNNAASLGYDVFYWRNDNEEVDFVIVKADKVVAIEVKSGRRSSNSGLARFRNVFAPHRSFVVGSGGIPLSDFLLADLSILFA